VYCTMYNYIFKKKLKLVFKIYLVILNYPTHRLKSYIKKVILLNFQKFFYKICTNLIIFCLLNIGCIIITLNFRILNIRMYPKSRTIESSLFLYSDLYSYCLKKRLLIQVDFYACNLQPKLSEFIVLKNCQVRNSN